MSDMGVNWENFKVFSDAGINWSDIDVLSDAARVSVELSMAVVLDSSSLQPKISWRINIKTKENRLKLRTI